LPENNQDARKFLIMINKYKGQITDLEIQCATQQVVIEDQRDKIAVLEKAVAEAAPAPEAASASAPAPADTTKKEKK
jgi:hypothetical protein